MAAPIPTPVKLKLLIDPKSNRLIFAEAGKDFVDFLFTILSLPVGTITRLLKKQEMVGWCLGNLYDSIENLDDTNIEYTANKDTLLKPMVFNCAANVSLTLLNMQSSSSLYGCNYPGRNSCSPYVANDPESVCLSCGNVMSRLLTFVNPTAAFQGLGYVKGAVTYMIMDDLVGLKLLRASMQSKAVLTDTFLVKKAEK
ncbi:hypothetical protein DITRI_Ditri09bG0121700 [Diplodiscus trichospermus]